MQKKLPHNIVNISSEYYKISKNSAYFAGDRDYFNKYLNKLGKF